MLKHTKHIITSIFSIIVLSLSAWYFSLIPTYTNSYGLKDPSAHNNSYIQTPSGSVLLNLTFLHPYYLNLTSFTLSWFYPTSTCTSILCNGQFSFQGCLDKLYYTTNFYYIETAVSNGQLDGLYWSFDSEFKIIIEMLSPFNSSLISNDGSQELLDIINSLQNTLFFDQLNIQNVLPDYYVTIFDYINIFGQFNYTLHMAANAFYDQLWHNLFSNDKWMASICNESLPVFMTQRDQYLRTYVSYKTWFEILTLSVSISGIFYNVLFYVLTKLAGDVVLMKQFFICSKEEMITKEATSTLQMISPCDTLILKDGKKNIVNQDPNG